MNSRVLIVDDTPANIQALVCILKDKGYKTTVATNGKQAIDLLALTGSASRRRIKMTDRTKLEQRLSAWEERLARAEQMYEDVLDDEQDNLSLGFSSTYEKAQCAAVIEECKDNIDELRYKIGCLGQEVEDDIHKLGVGAAPVPGTKAAGPGTDHSQRPANVIEVDEAFSGNNSPKKLVTPATNAEKMRQSKYFNERRLFERFLKDDMHDSKTHGNTIAARIRRAKKKMPMLAPVPDGRIRKWYKKIVVD